VSADIRQWQESEGRSDEEMAELLSDRLGREISAQGYRIGKSKKSPPAAWLHALNIAPQEPSDSLADAGASPPEGDREPVTRTVLPLPFDPAPVRTQIVLMYTVAGKGASLALRTPQVADVWAQHATPIADAYIEWAKEDANVARILNAITLGGPKGELVMLHGSMLVTSLIISGKFDPNKLIPPPMRQPQETDNLADDGSVVIDIDPDGGEHGDTGADVPTPPKRTRRKAPTA
jgi:hypothetical protein